MAGKKRQTLLTNLELAVMRAVWDSQSGPPTVRDVVAELNAGRRKPLAYNTVQTMLTILKEKGVVESKAGAGRAHRFRPKVTRAEVTTSMVGDLVERLFDGNVQPLLLQLVGNESMSRDELQNLKMIIESQLDDDEEA